MLCSSLAGKEWKELAASRAWWVLLVMVGPLVGHSFITAVDTYAEASGLGGGPAALAQGLSPLDGILVPTFGAYDLAVTLLFPFVAIRMIAAERESGAWKLMLQAPAGIGLQVAIKMAVLLGAWILAWIPGLAAAGLWLAYGGTAYWPELGDLLLGHVLRVVVGAGIAFAAAALANNASSAAIATLGFTVGTWALDFVAAGRGGLLQEIAAYTPTAALRTFEQGQLRLRTVAVSLAFGVAGLAVARIWLDIGRTWIWRTQRTLAAVLLTAAAVAGGASLRTAWDVSENRRNSFTPAEERALGAIQQPLRITVNLAPEDPRLMDLERNILSKLERIVPRVEIAYASRGRSGLFEGQGEHYGEVWYELNGRKVMSRSTTEPIVLETIFGLAGMAVPPARSGPAYGGHPLAARPLYANWLYYGGWPLVVVLAGWLHFRRG